MPSPASLTFHQGLHVVVHVCVRVGVILCSCLTHAGLCNQQGDSRFYRVLLGECVPAGDVGCPGLVYSLRPGH